MYFPTFLIGVLFAYLVDYSKAFPLPGRSGMACNVGAAGGKCENIDKECFPLWNALVNGMNRTSVTDNVICKHFAKAKVSRNGNGINQDNKANDKTASSSTKVEDMLDRATLLNDVEDTNPTEDKCLTMSDVPCFMDFFHQHQRDTCVAKGGLYIKDESFCDLRKDANFTATFGKMRDVDDAEKGLSVSGNVFSIPALACLLFVFRLVSELGRLPGRNIVVMSLSMMLAHSLHIVSINVNTVPPLCRIAGIFLHWAYIAMFTWTTIVAVDLASSYTEIYRTNLSEDEKFHRYQIVGFTLPTCLIILYVTVDLSTGRSVGYGLDNYCFLAHFWATISFAIVAVIALFVNVICVVLTSKAMKVGTQASIWILERERSSFEQAFFLALRIVQVWTLVGLGVILKVISKIVGNTLLLYLSEVLMSYQGLLLLIAVLCNRRVLNLISASVAMKFQRRSSKVAPLPEFFSESFSK